MKKIKSPISQEFLLERKLMEFFESVGVEKFFVFCMPVEGNIVAMSHDMCGHQIKTLAETLLEESEEMLDHED